MTDSELTTRYRLYVGETGPEDAPRIARLLRDVAHVDGATLIPAVGVWEGEIESSTIVEIIGRENWLLNARYVAHVLAHAFDQDCVLLTVDRLARPAEFRK